MIVFEHVSKIFKNNWTALYDINLNVNKGEFVFLVGPTGAGKSTLLKLIYCGDSASSGKLNVMSYPLHDSLSDAQITQLRRKIGIVFQDFKLLLDRTVYENIEFTLRVIGIRPLLIPEIVTSALNKVGLYNRKDFYPYQLSGGEQQKIAIARAIAKNPEILLADEPTGNIDYKGSTEILRILKDINFNGTTVLMATHDHIIAETSNKRIVRLENGKLLSDGD
ncbi:MAG: ATP-binding cassette domain-containing protein [Candidatus Latescibacteria bacterium]|nr:ATP-binding cassette domain-containing protein [Candidatus Latescibacterota bacterium]